MKKNNMDFIVFDKEIKASRTKDHPVLKILKKEYIVKGYVIAAISLMLALGWLFLINLLK